MADWTEADSKWLRDWLGPHELARISRAVVWEVEKKKDDQREVHSHALIVNEDGEILWTPSREGCKLCEPAD